MWQQNEEQLHQFVDSMPVGVVVVDRDEKTFYINRQAKQIFNISEPLARSGLTLEALVTRFPLYVAGTEQKYSFEHLPLVQALQGERVNVDDIEIILPDRRVPLEVSASPICDEQGEVCYAVAVYRDITDRKQITAELNEYRLRLEDMVAQRTNDLAAVNVQLQQDIVKRQQIEEELRKLSRAVEQSASTVVITDLSGTIEFVNPAFTRITGYKPEEAIGQNTRILKSGKMPPETYQDLWTTISSGGVWEGELLNRKKDGELYWELVTISPVKDNEGNVTHYLAIKEDITARKQAEELLQESYQKNQTANEQLAIIQEIGQAISAHLQLDVLLEVVTQSTAKLLGTDTATILLVDEKRQTLQVKRAYGLRKHPIQDNQNRLDKSIAGQVVLNGQPVIINDLPNHPTAYTATAKNEGLLAYASVPLIVVDRVIGTLDVHSKTDPEAFDEDQIYFLHLLAGQAAIAIENSRLFEEERKAKEVAEQANSALATLNTIAFTVNTSLDLEADLHQALEIILQELRLERGWIFIPEDNNRFLRLAASLGLPEDFQQREALTLVGRCECEKALAAGTWRHHFERDACSRLMSYHEKDPSLSVKHITLPIFAKQEIVGLLNLGGDNTATLTTENYEWLETVARQLGNAIENATLYQNVLGKTDRLSALNRVSTIVSHSLDLDDILPPLLREMARVLETSLGIVVLRAKEGKDRYKVRARFGLWQSPAALDNVPWHLFPVLDIIAQTQAPLMIAQTAGDERLTPIAATIEQEKIQTVLVLPLVVLNQLTGFILLGTMGWDRIFESTEIELARTLTNQAAVAIEKARLYEETVTRYEEELEIARQIQQNLLPGRVPHIPGLRIAGLCRPAYATGGDFYDFVQLPDRRLGIVVSDVTGKSLPAAMVMALARNTVRSELLNHRWPAEAMTAANQRLYQDTQPETFIATVEALIDPADRKMWLVNAGQTAALQLSNGHLHYLLPDEAVGLPLGIDPEAVYTHAQILLQSGDILLFYTDGIVEAKNPNGDMFGFERLESTMQQLENGYTPEQIVDQLMEEMQSFVDGAEQSDDITLVAVQVE